jgi:ABC-type transporter MlaC component
MKIFSLAVLLLSLVWVSPLRADEAAPAKPAAAKAESPEAAKLRENIVELFETSKKVGSTEPAERKKARDRVEKSLDWDRIAKDCLGPKRWGAQSAKNRKEFRDLLQDVVVRTAFSRLDKFWKDTQGYTIEKVDVKGSNAHVASKFIVDNEDFLLEYYMSKAGGNWMIYDIAYEDLKYSENISEQIIAFMKDNQFSTLLDKLRKRRDELKDEKPAAAASETKKG